MTAEAKLQAESNLRFYMRRASQERQAAARAITPAARERHELLANRFRAQIEEVQALFQAA